MADVATAPPSVASAFPASAALWPGEVLTQIFCCHPRRARLLVFARICRRWRELVFRTVVSLPAAAPPNSYAKFPNLVDLEAPWGAGLPELIPTTIGGRMAVSPLIPLPTQITRLVVLPQRRVNLVSRDCFCVQLTRLSSLLSLTYDLTCPCSTDYLLHHCSALTSLASNSPPKHTVFLPRLSSVTVRSQFVDLLHANAKKLTSLIWTEFYPVHTVPAMPRLLTLSIDTKKSPSFNPSSPLRQLLSLCASLTSLSLVLADDMLSPGQMQALIGRCAPVLTRLRLQLREPLPELARVLADCSLLTSLDCTFAQDECVGTYLPIVFPRLLSLSFLRPEHTPELPLLLLATRLTSLRVPPPLFAAMARQWEFTQLRSLELDAMHQLSPLLERVLPRMPVLRAMTIDAGYGEPDLLRLHAAIRLAETHGVEELIIRHWNWSSHTRADIASKYRWMRIVWYQFALK